MLVTKIKNKYQIVCNRNDTKYKLAGSTIDGFSVGHNIPNTDSISASLTDYEILKGVRVIATSEFSLVSYYAKNDWDRIDQLVDLISHNKYIDPLIVVEDNEGLYVLEGGHRLGAIQKLKIKHFPALVVLDLESLDK